MKKVLFITVGGSCEPIITSIKNHKPDYVYFFCSDDITFPKVNKGTYLAVDGQGLPCKGKYGEGKPSIVVQTNLQKDQYRIIKFPHQDDLSECYSSIIEAVAEARETFPNCVIFADYTGGTKTMSAAMVSAALDDGEIELVLVGGERIDWNKVRSGSQRVVCNWKPMHWRRRFKVMAELFSHYDYPGCLRLAEEYSSEVVSGSSEEKTIQAYITLSRAYLEWDRFCHEEAIAYFEPYRRWFYKDMQYLEIIIRTKQALKNGLGEGAKIDFSPVHDLLLNAERKMARGNYDDAVARLYRGLEMFAQLCLLFHKPSIHTADVDVEKLPEALRPKYLALKNRQGEQSKGKLQIPLLKSYELLAELEHPVGRLYTQLSKRLIQLLIIRNHSILAHGFNPIGEEDARELYDFISWLVEEGERQLGIPSGRENAVQFSRELPQEFR